MLFQMDSCTNLGSVEGYVTVDYSVTDLKDSDVLGHISFANLYEKKAVCVYCKAMYDKIDHLRVNSDNENNIYLYNPQKMVRAIKDYNSDRDKKEYNNTRAVKGKNRIDFTNDFYLNLEFFDLPKKESEYQLLKKQLGPQNTIHSARKTKNPEEDREEKQIKERLSQIGSEAKVNNKKASEVSLKLHLGSKEKVKINNPKNAITSSTSIKLASLQSVGSR
jgi:hypothetical protein